MSFNLNQCLDSISLLTVAVSISLVHINPSKHRISIHVFERVHVDGRRCYRLKFNIFVDKRSAKVLRALKFTRDIVCKLVNNKVSVYLKINYLLINCMQNVRQRGKINIASQ